MRIKSVFRALATSACACLAVTATSAADVDKTVAQKDGWASYAKLLVDKVEGVNKKCGSSMTASYDKSSNT